MKRIIEIDDNLSDILQEVINKVKNELVLFLKDNPDAGTPRLSDLNYSGRIHQIIDDSVPILDDEIKGLWYLYGEEFENAFDAAGIGNKNDDWPRGWKAAAIYCYIDEKVRERLAPWLESGGDILLHR